MEDDPELFYLMPEKELLEYVNYERFSSRRFMIPEESLEVEPFSPDPLTEAKVDRPYSPKAKKSKGEMECKQVLEDYFGKSFMTYRPDFIKDKRNLELDLFNPELGLACEYHGKQHYYYPSRFIKKKKVFVEQLRRDLYKLHKCKQLGIYVLVVPFTCKDIQKFVLDKLDSVPKFRSNYIRGLLM